MPNSNVYIVFFLLGLCFGSFSNVLILRDNRRASIVTGRSECPRCKHVLAWYELIPLLSFVIQGGRCRSCKKIISWQYPLVELLMAALFLLAAWYGAGLHGSIVLAVALAVAFLLFLVVAGIDVLTMTVPLEYIVAAGIIGGIGMRVTHIQTWQSLGLGLLLGATSIAAVMYLWKFLFRQDAMGSGDIWIAGAAGAILGYPLVLSGLAYAIFTGAIIGIVMAAKEKKGLQTAIPFGPFLFVGLILGLLWGQAFLRLYTISI